jgi:hypothetical protein
MGIHRGRCEKAAHPLIESLFRLLPGLIRSVVVGLIEVLQPLGKIPGRKRLEGAQRDHSAWVFSVNNRRRRLIVWKPLTRCSFCQQRHERIQEMLFVPTRHLKSTSSARWIQFCLRCSGRVLKPCLFELH